MIDLYYLIEELYKHPEFIKYYSYSIGREYYYDIPISMLQEKFNLSLEDFKAMKEDCHVWKIIDGDKVSFGMFA